MNHGVGAAVLIDCMALMALLGGRRPRAFITNTEKAKKTPPTTPQPSAATAVRTGRDRSIAFAPFSDPTRRWRRCRVRSR